MTVELSSALTTLVWMLIGIASIVYILVIQMVCGSFTIKVEHKGSTATADNAFTAQAARANANAQEAARDAAKANLEAEHARLERAHIEQQG